MENTESPSDNGGTSKTLTPWQTRTPRQVSVRQPRKPLAPAARAGDSRGPRVPVLRWRGTQVKKLAAARLRAMVDPALGVLEYAMRRKDKDLRGALQAAKEVLERAKPGGEGDGLEARTEIIVEYVRPKES